jgi:Ca2+-binding RTX toxin-like protein
MRSVFEGDNGTLWANYVDTANAGSWLWQTAHVNPSGAAIEVTTTNDDGTHTLTLFDPDHVYSFTNATISYDANWNQTGVTELNDDASTTVRPGEIGAALDTTTWFTTPYDPDSAVAATAQTLTGGGNTDVLYGFGGNDTLDGGAGNDLLNGGAGDDTLTGGTGDDTFLFTLGDGNDVITDFAPGASNHDTISLHGYGVDAFAQLQALMAQVGNDTVITFDSYNQIILQNVTMGALTAGDFLFS